MGDVVVGCNTTADSVVFVMLIGEISALFPKFRGSQNIELNPIQVQPSGKFT